MPAGAKTDRRVQKTRKILIDALIALTQEKGYDNVTVQDIIERANVGRSTFYSHFEGKDHLLTGNDNFRDLLSRSLARHSKTGINIAHIYEHVAEYHDLAKAFLTKKGDTLIADHFHNIFVHVTKEHFRHMIKQEKIGKKMFNMLVDAAASAMCSLLFNWTINQMPYSPSEMEATSNKILDGIFRSYI